MEWATKFIAATWNFWLGKVHKVYADNAIPRPWIMNGKGIAEKIRDPTQVSYLRLAEVVEEACIKCPTCQHSADCSNVPILWPKLPIGIKFDPSDSELLQHLEERSNPTNLESSVIVNQFIATIEEPEGICYTHPENLPGIKTDGSSRHFFHRISNAYGCGHRKRRKIDNHHTASDDKKVRWHKTGRSKEVYDESGAKRGWKKILVLHTGSKKAGVKTDRAGWVMHQYHLGADEAEKDRQFVVSKIFYQSASKQVDKSAMNVPVVEQDASAVKIDPRTPNTDPPQPLRPNNSTCKTEQHTSPFLLDQTAPLRPSNSTCETEQHTSSPFLLDQGKAESSTSNIGVTGEAECPVWFAGLSQIFEDSALADFNELCVTGTQGFVAEPGSDSGAQTFLDNGKAVVSSTQVLEPDAGPGSQLSKGSWESGVQDVHLGSQDNLLALLELESFYNSDLDAF